MICQPCLETGKNRSAASWCLQCNDPLCNDCKRHHQVLKATKHHDILSLDEYKSVSKVMDNVSSTCTRHSGNNQFTYFCRSHDEPLCTSCRETDHKSCLDVGKLEDFASNVKSSFLCEDLHGRVSKTLENLKSLPQDIKSKLHGIDTEGRNLKTLVLKTTENAVKHIKSLEKSILAEYAKVSEQEQTKLRRVEESIADKKSKVESILKTLNDVIPKMSDVQAFLTVTQISRDQRKEEIFLEEYHTNNASLSVNINLSEQILGIENIPSFGSLKVKRSPPKSPFPGSCNKQSPVEISYKVVATLGLVPIENKMKVTDIKELDKNVFVMTDSVSKKIITYNSKDKIQREYEVGREPDCIAVIDCKTIAFVNEHRHIGILDMQSATILNSFDMEDHVEGLTIAENKMIVNCRRMGLRFFSVFGQCIGGIPGITGEFYLHATRSGRIIFSDQVKDTLTCVSIDGRKIFSIQEQMNQPYGIASDQNDNIYVVSISSSSILKISPDGLKKTQIMTAKDGLETPFVLALLRDNSMLIANNSGQSVQIFKQK